MAMKVPYDIQQYPEADDALEAFNDLELQLARLRRQHLISENTCLSVQQEVAAIRDRLEDQLRTALLPKGPRLP